MTNKPPLMELDIPTADRGFYSGFAKSVAIPSKLLVSALIDSRPRLFDPFRGPRLFRSADSPALTCRTSMQTVSNFVPGDRRRPRAAQRGPRWGSGRGQRKACATMAEPT